MTPNRCVILVSTLLLFGSAASMRVAAEEEGFPEFTALHTVISRNQQSGVSKSQSKTFAQRADGSRAERVVVQEGAPEPRVMTRTSVLSVKHGVRIDSYREVSLKSTYPLSKVEISRYSARRKPDANCSSDMLDSPYELAGTQKMFGYVVVKFIQDLPNTHAEMFRAPDLDCYILLRLTHRKDAASGKVTDVFRDEVYSVTKGAPEPGLFDTNLEGYTEAIPSQIQATIRKKYFPKEPECSSCKSHWHLLDQRYYAARSRRNQ